MKKFLKFAYMILCLMFIGTFTVACGGGGGGDSASGGGFGYFPAGANGNGGNGTINPISPDAEYSFDNTKEASVSFTDGKTEKNTPTISSLESTLSVEMPDSWEITDTKNVEGLTKGNYRFINNWLYTTNDSGSASEKLTFNLPVNSGERRTEKVKIKSGDKTYTLTIIQAGFKEDPEKRGNISADKTLFEVDSLSSTNTDTNQAINLNSTKEKVKITAPNFQGELKVLGGQVLDVSGGVAVDNYRVVDLIIYENPLGYREVKIRIFANTDYIDITVKQKGAFAVGEGTEDNPFIISNLDDLNKLSKVGFLSAFGNIMLADKNFKINSDISGITSPIRFPDTHNIGKICTIDGNGKKLTANINVTDGNASLFINNSAIGINCSGIIKNLTVAGKITTNSSNNTNYYACGIAYSYSNIAISNCINEAEVTATGEYPSAYGISNSGTITNCTNKGKITATYRACGIGGSTISDCTNETDVTTTGEYESHASGITDSYNGIVTITNCTNKGKITASGNSYPYAGGISANTNEGSVISNCTNEGDVTSSHYAGGIVSYSSRATIKNCQHKSGIIKGEVNEDYNYSGYIAGNASDESGLKISGCKYKKATGSTATKGVGNYEDSESGCTNDETI